MTEGRRGSEDTDTRGQSVRKGTDGPTQICHVLSQLGLVPTSLSGWLVQKNFESKVRRGFRAHLVSLKELKGAGTFCQPSIGLHEKTSMGP